MTLRVTIEIVPFGIENNKRTLNILNIHNIGKVEHLLEDDLKEHVSDFYQYEVDETDENGEKKEPYTVIHQRSKGFWDLIYRATWDRIFKL